jgi:diguanylate cyclase (GGDEF)-like protein/PAS domain S-box-containing protein/hemerythrin-like metal-binding protein
LLLALIPTFIAIRFAKLTKELKKSIAASKQTNDALRDSEALYRAILQASPDGITVTDIEGRIRKMSAAVLTMFGYEHEDAALGRHISDFIIPEDHERAFANIGLMFQGERPGPGIYRAIRGDGSEFMYEVNGEFILSPDGQPIRMVFIGRDVTERIKAKEGLEASNRLLETLSGTDALTGLANRRRFDAVLDQEYARHTRSGAYLSLILMDIDHFKAFNDTYGHVKGDDCLRRIAQAITGCTVRAADLPARYGGEEFACILPETDLSGAVTIAEKIRLAITSLDIPHKTSCTQNCVSASIGVVTVSCSPNLTVSDIIMLADTMLYKAKSNGRNRVEADASFGDIKLSGTTAGTSPVLLAWKDSFYSGNELIDRQHTTLFRTSNELLEAIITERPAADISKHITLLLDEIALHFHDEEAILESVGFSGLKRHTQEHARLLEEGRSLLKTLNQDTKAIGNIFKFVVYEVVLHHTLSADREFFPCLETAKTNQPTVHEA